MWLACWCCSCCFFFFQAEDGIRDYDVTGVQTCAVFRSRDFWRFRRYALASSLVRRPSPFASASGNCLSHRASCCSVCWPDTKPLLRSSNKVRNDKANWFFIAIYLPRWIWALSMIRIGVWRGFNHRCSGEERAGATKKILTAQIS